MFSPNLHRFLISTFGALIFSAACVIGAVGPARAEIVQLGVR